MGKIFGKIYHLIIEIMMQLCLLLLFVTTFVIIYIITGCLIIRDKLYGIKKKQYRYLLTIFLSSLLTSAIYGHWLCALCFRIYYAKLLALLSSFPGALHLSLLLSPMNIFVNLSCRYLNHCSLALKWQVVKRA